MARQPTKRKQPLTPDFKYDSQKVARFINYVMQDGKKNVARDIVYQAFEEIKEQKKVDDPLKVFDEALDNVGPRMEVRSRRVGGANYQVPYEVNSKRRTQLAFRWIIGAARSARKNTPFYKVLANEIIQASEKEGDAMRKREASHRMAEANKAFAHFAW